MDLTTVTSGSSGLEEQSAPAPIAPGITPPAPATVAVAEIIEKQDYANILDQDTTMTGTSPPFTTTASGPASTRTSIPPPLPPATGPGTGLEERNPLSKNAQKKLAKEKAWLEKKAEKKEMQKMKRKEGRVRKQEAKRAGRKAGGIVVGEVEENKASGEKNGDGENIDRKDAPVVPTATAAGQKRKSSTTSSPSKSQDKKRRLITPEPITLLIDCAFDDLMTDKEIVSLSSQITRCYSDNRASTHPVSLHISSLNKRLLARFTTTLHNSHLNWKRITFSPDPYPTTPSTSLIYLTSDSPTTLTELTPNTTYIIGGIVDRNRHKGLCYKKAMDQGVKTAKLPIGEYIRMSSRFVLTTNQVVEIMLRWLECRDWEGAFLKVIPQRKQPMGKKAGADGEGDGKVEEVAGDEEEDGEGEEGEAGQDEEGGGGASEQGQHQKEETNDAMANVVEGIPPNAVAESTSTTKEPVETTI